MAKDGRLIRAKYSLIIIKAKQHQANTKANLIHSRTASLKDSITAHRETPRNKTSMAFHHKGASAQQPSTWQAFTANKNGVSKQCTRQIVEAKAPIPSDLRRKEFNI